MRIENPPVNDPSLEEAKKEEKKTLKKDAKGKVIEEEE